MTCCYAVTGSNGHLGSTLVSKLLARGDYVHGIVRSRARFLTSHPRLRIFEADLFDVSRLTECFKGVTGVFHTAAPTGMWARDIETEITRPIVEGSLNVIEAAANAAASRVVHTSSAAAVGLKSAEPMNESVWNESTRHPQFAAKIAAEREGRARALALGVEFIRVCPPSVLGPGFHIDTPSTEPYRLLVEGKLGFLPPMVFQVVDVRDQAQAQIEIMLSKNPKEERYIIAGHRVNLLDVVAEISGLFPSFNLPSKTLPKPYFVFLSYLEGMLFHLGMLASRKLDYYTVNECIGCQQLLDGRRIVEEFGVSFRPLRETLFDTVQAILKS